MITIQNLNKKFGKLQVLNNLNLEIETGGVFAILGPNGSGKTTLLKCLLGMVIPDSGFIKFKEKNINGRWDYRKDILYLPQIADFPPNLTVKEIIHVVKNIRNTEANEQILIQEFGLEPFLQKKLNYLSGGTKQKVNIVLAFMFCGNLIILDEPTNGLDPISVIKLKDLIKQKVEEGRTVFITSHIMSFVEEVADKIVFLLDGKIHYMGTVEDLKTKTNSADLERAIANLLLN